MSQNLEKPVRHSIRTEIDELRRFADRQIAELSREIHGTVQLVDYSETSLSAHPRTDRQGVCRTSRDDQQQRRRTRSRCASE